MNTQDVPDNAPVPRVLSISADGKQATVDLTPYLEQEPVLEHHQIKVGDPLYPCWLVDMMGSLLEEKNGAHPPSRDCPCTTCVETFQSKDSHPPDGAYYAASDPRCQMDDRVLPQAAEEVCVQALAALDSVQTLKHFKDGRDPKDVLRSFIQLTQLSARKQTPSNQAIAEWNPTNAQVALVMALNGTSEQQEEARKFFAYHLKL